MSLLRLQTTPPHGVTIYLSTDHVTAISPIDAVTSQIELSTGTIYKVSGSAADLARQLGAGIQQFP